MAYRWLTLLSPLDPAERPPFLVLMRVFFVSTFLGTFLPASVGGDAVRAYGLSRLGVGGADAVASVLMDRLLGILSILLVAIARVGARPQPRRDPSPGAGTRVAHRALLYCARGGLQPAHCGGRSGLCSSVFPGGRTPDIGLWLRYSDTPATAATSRACSALLCWYRCFECFRHTASGLALGIALPVGVYFALVPLILLIVLMPITINGIGTVSGGISVAVWPRRRCECTRLRAVCAVPRDRRGRQSTRRAAVRVRKRDGEQGLGRG